jgi:NAD(P)-dependent dehydrogenase (short-subunit alcohol dehydrogenase family)
MGLASAHILAGRGAILALADINEKALNAALKSLQGDKHIADVVDVRNGQQVTAWIEKIAKTLGKLDGAANVAGVCRDPCAIVDESDDTWNFTVGTFPFSLPCPGLANTRQMSMPRASSTACVHS